MPYITSEEKEKKLSLLKQRSDLITLDLRNFGLSFENISDIQTICELIKNNPNLEEVYLSNNDLQRKISDIFKALETCPNLRVLDIVDNNIDCEQTWEDLGTLIINNTKLKEIYIGAKRITGVSNMRHTYVDYDCGKANPTLFHNYPINEGYYGTGFNEIVMRDVDVFEKALKIRAGIQNHVNIFYLVSPERTTTQISKEGGRFSFNREEQPNPTKKSLLQSLKYNREFYKQDCDNEKKCQELLLKTSQSSQ